MREHGSADTHKDPHAPFPLNPTILHFNPDEVDNYRFLISELYRRHVGAVAALTSASDPMLADHVRQFGVHWVQLGGVSPESLKRLSAGFRRFRVALASHDTPEVRRHLGAHVMFRKLRFERLIQADIDTV